MRKELPPLPSESAPSDERAEVDLDRVIQDIDMRLKILEGAFSQMTVNNQTRQVMWTGVVQGIAATGGSAGVGMGGGGTGYSTGAERDKTNQIRNLYKQQAMQIADRWNKT